MGYYGIDGWGTKTLDRSRKYLPFILIFLLRLFHYLLPIQIKPFITKTRTVKKPLKMNMVLSTKSLVLPIEKRSQTQHIVKITIKTIFECP